MKFGKKLSNAIKPEWSLYYLDYDEAKRMIKSGTLLSGKFSEKDEGNFVEFLERELDKVNSFQSARVKELLARIEECERAISKFINLVPLDSMNNIEVRLKPVKEEMSRITFEITDLSKYMRLNYSGFIKILKKHDKYTSYKSKPMFMVHLESKPFYKEDFDKLIIRMSRLYELSRTISLGDKEQSTAPTSSASGASQNFIRRTTKYWVHEENVTEVKCIILKYLPVLVYSSKGEKEPDPAITSIYFDNDSFELYQGRLEKSEGAQAIRLRWYGNMSQTEIFVERKTHREDWTGESSIKARFPIKEKYVNDFLKGTYSMDKSIAKMRARQQKSESELQELQELSCQVQSTILEKKLHPMVRTFYNRTAFQLPGDARVRISLDTDLTMIREDNEGIPRSGSNWRRMDIGTKTPFQVDADDICRFPHAILEVKLQTQHGTQVPAWVDELVKSHLVEEVPKFSKFIHGVATLLDHKITLLPFWLPQMDVDIRKVPAIGYQGSFSSSFKEDSLGLKKMTTSDIEIVVDGNPSSSSVVPTGSISKKKQVDFQQGQDEVDVGQELEEEEQDESTPLLPSTSSPSRKGKSIFHKVSSLFTSQPTPTPFNAKSVTGTGAVPSKRIILPVRVEPKVFFANERTFLSWLHFCIVLGGLALGLLNFGDQVGQISGLIFTVVAMMFIIYALFLYQWRAHRIRNRHPGPYDDRIGPTVLVTALFFAILTNFYLKFKNGLT